jgi:hypothetical protein
MRVRFWKTKGILANLETVAKTSRRHRGIGSEYTPTQKIAMLGWLAKAPGR